MSGRFPALCLLAGLLAGSFSLQAATPTEGSRVSQKLLESYQRDDPAEVAKVAQPLAVKGNAEAQFVLGLFQLIGAGVRLDHASATDWLKKSAAQGHLMARLCLAWQYDAGFGVPKVDPAAAAELLAQATPAAGDTGYARWFSHEYKGYRPNFGSSFLWLIDHADTDTPFVLANLADVYLSNFWTAADATQHLYWLERAVTAGDLVSVQRLSVYYDAGLFVVADPVKALTLRRKAAASLRESQFLLGAQFEDGRGVDRNITEAVRWYQQAAKQDYAPALQRLVFLYRNGSPGLVRDFNQAVKLAERGRKLGDAECIRHLADLYNRGDGVALNYNKSAELYREAAAKGEINAMTMLGWIYRHGEIGKPDYVAARLWYNQAAVLGNIRAMRELGELNEQGLGGPVDLPATFEWHERAARAGESESQEKVGLMLAGGRGVPADPEEAVNWLRLAALNANTPTLSPRYLPSSPDPALAWFDGLVAVAREYRDQWLLDNLVAAVVADPRRAEFEKRLLAILDEPGLLAVPGVLPEACFLVLEANNTDPEIQRQTDAFFLRLRQADRVQSALLLGRSAFLGRHTPVDLSAALRWAKVASANTPWKGSLLLAQIEVLDSPEPARRATSWETIRKCAYAGDLEAAILVIERLAAGQGNAEDQALGEQRINACLAYARKMGQTVLVAELEKPGKQLNRAPTDNEMAQQVASLLAARRPGTDAQPQVVYRPPPYYPGSLRAAGVGGNVNLEFVIGNDGRVIDVVVTRSNHELFSRMAVAAVLQWRFAPGWKKGRAVNVRAAQILEFNAR